MLSSAWSCNETVNLTDIETKAEANDLAASVNRDGFKQEPRSVGRYQSVQIHHDSLSPQEGAAEVVLGVAGLPHHFGFVVKADRDAGKASITWYSSEIRHHALPPEES